VRKGTKEYLIAQDYVQTGTYYYLVQAETMGEAIVKIEHDPDTLPVDAAHHQFMVMSYTDAEDNYDS